MAAANAIATAAATDPPATPNNSPISTPLFSPSSPVSASSISAPWRSPIGGTDPRRLAMIERAILDLADPNRCESAIALLAKQKGCSELAPMLWGSFGTIVVLLGEIISIFPFLSPPTLTLAQSNRVCNALALIQCIASNPNTKGPLVKALIPIYLLQFIKITCVGKAFELLKLHSLGVIGALVKVPDTDVVLFLLSREFMPACLTAMESGSELSKTVSTFIVQRIMLDDLGIEYVCSTRDRLYAVLKALANVVAGCVEYPSTRLIKHVIRCYLRLSQHERSRSLLRSTIPTRLLDGTFHHCLWDDDAAKSALQQLLENIYRPTTAFVQRVIQAAQEKIPHVYMPPHILGQEVATSESSFCPLEPVTSCLSWLV